MILVWNKHLPKANHQRDSLSLEVLADLLETVYVLESQSEKGSHCHGSVLAQRRKSLTISGLPPSLTYCLQPPTNGIFLTQLTEEHLGEFCNAFLKDG